MFTITSMVIVTLIKNVGKPTFIFTDFLHFILPFTREEKIKAVKMVLVEKKSQMEVERTVLGKKKCTGTINRWIREYIQEGEENCFKKEERIKKS